MPNMNVHVTQEQIARKDTTGLTWEQVVEAGITTGENKNQAKESSVGQEKQN